MEEAGASRPHGDLKPGLDRARYSTSGTTAPDSVEWVTLGWKVSAVSTRWRCSAVKQVFQAATTTPQIFMRLFAHLAAPTHIFKII